MRSFPIALVTAFLALSSTSGAWAGKYKVKAVKPGGDRVTTLKSIGGRDVLHTLERKDGTVKRQTLLIPDRMFGPQQTTTAFYRPTQPGKKVGSTKGISTVGVRGATVHTAHVRNDESGRVTSKLEKKLERGVRGPRRAVKSSFIDGDSKVKLKRLFVGDRPVGEIRKSRRLNPEAAEP